MIYRKIPWTVQPQFPVEVDRSNPLAKDWRGSHLAGGGLRELTLAGTASSAVSRAGKGVSIASRAAGNFVATTSDILPTGNTKYTLIQIVAPADKAANPGQDCFSQGTNADGRLVLLAVQAGTLQDSWWSATNDISATYTPANNELAVIASTYDGVTKRLYVNGLEIANKVVSGVVFNLDTGNSSLVGKRGTNTANGFAGFVGTSHVFSRALSGVEIKSLSDNMWQIFRPQTRRIWVPVSGETTASITGQSLSVSQGSLTGNVQASVTGQALTVSQGAVVGSVSTPITGQALTLSQGQVTAAIQAAITGQALSVAQGALTGSVLTPITGQALNVALGNVSTAGEVFATITGQALSVYQGQVIAAISPTITGQSIAVSQGALTGAVTSAITGQALSIAQGTLTGSVQTSIAGQALTVSLGNVSTSGDITAAITGQSLAISQGMFTGAVASSVTGNTLIESYINFNHTISSESNYKHTLVSSLNAVH